MVVATAVTVPRESKRQSKGILVRNRKHSGGHGGESNLPQEVSRLPEFLVWRAQGERFAPMENFALTVAHIE